MLNFTLVCFAHGDWLIMRLASCSLQSEAFFSFQKSPATRIGTLKQNAIAVVQPTAHGENRGVNPTNFVFHRLASS